MEAIETHLRSMYKDAQRSKELLTEIICQDHFENIFTPGEQQSIREIDKNLKIKSELLFGAVASVKKLFAKHR